MSSFNVPFDGSGGLIDQMKGQDSLGGWDVLVPYNEVQLNALLADRAASLKISSPDSWEAVDEDPITGDTRTIVFNVNLLQPTMKFVDATGSINLTFGLAGTYHVKPDGKDISLPTGLTCELSTSLVNVAHPRHSGR